MTEIFATHECMRTLGKGRMGTVKLYRQNSSMASSAVTLKAVKIIKRSDVTTSAMTARIFSEKKALSAISGHPYALSLIETHKDSENLYFILSAELGGPLYKHFRSSQSGKFAYTRARYYLMNIISALLYMHAKGFVHRDVKASNVLLSRTGNAVLADFGYAKNILATGAPGSPPAPEPTFTFCGTLHCMAPEVVRRTGHVFAADWWSVGVLLYEMIAGFPPWGYGVGEVEKEQVSQ